MPPLPYCLNGTHNCTCKRCPTVTGWLPLALDRVKWQDLVNTIMKLQVTKHAWNFLTIWRSISFSRMTVLVQSTRGLNIKADANGAQPNMLKWMQLPICHSLWTHTAAHHQQPVPSNTAKSTITEMDVHSTISFISFFPNGYSRLYSVYWRG
jgi:hypothetical protein